MAIRLADLLAALSRLADLGFGFSAGETLRSSALAVRLARSLELPDDEVRAALYTALLHHVGCTAFAHETATVYGDEHGMNAAASRTDLADLPRDLLRTYFPMLLRDRPPLERARLLLFEATRGKRFGEEYINATCEVGRDTARRLGLPDPVQRGVYHVFELWKGGGEPGRLAGDDIPIASRIARLTGVAALFDTIGGTDLAVDAVRRRGGGMLDPALVEHFLARAEGLLAEINNVDPRSVVLDAEPAPAASVPEGDLVTVAVVFADLADLKSPYFHGHSSGVARLARAAADALALPPATVADLELAGLLHDVGRVAVSARLWEKPGSLTRDEWEQVRLHAYHSERILAGSQRLASLAPVAGMHHERLDGGGYHRGSKGADVPMPARVLAAADAYHAMTQPRPHRAALPPERAEQALLGDVRSGLLDGDAVSAVLAAAGRRAVTAKRELPAGLSDREVEVLRLVARGCSNAQIAQRLVISRRTAEHHVQHIYTKIGVSSRAAVALFAMEHHLLGSGDR